MLILNMLGPGGSLDPPVVMMKSVFLCKTDKYKNKIMKANSSCDDKDGWAGADRGGVDQEF